MKGIGIRTGTGFESQTTGPQTTNLPSVTFLGDGEKTQKSTLSYILTRSPNLFHRDPLKKPTNLPI